MNQETSRPSLVFESIELVSAPGMAHGFRLAGFQPGLNVVWGPNASGKSTTARALHSLFWPDRPDDRTLVEASFRFNQSNWFIERNGKHVSATRNGSNHAALTFTQLSAETRDRYLLALHDLIRGDDRSFAAYIAKEMSADSISKMRSKRPVSKRTSTRSASKSNSTRQLHSIAS
ncbi:MAG: AAA family ATPase [Thermomicrobiales bacterium]